MNASVTTSSDARQQAAFDRIAQKAKNYAMKTGKGWLSSLNGGLSEAGDLASDFGDLLGTDTEGKNPIVKLFGSIMDFFKPFIEWCKGLLGLLDPNATLAEKVIPETVARNAGFKALATKMGLKEEIGSDIQKMVAESAKSYLEDGIPSFNSDGTQTNTINHVIKTHDEIVVHLAGAKGRSVGRLAQQYPDMPVEKRQQLAERLASYVTGLPPQPEGGYDLAQLVRKNPDGQYTNIKGGLAQMLLGVQAKAKNGPKGSLQESDIVLAFDDSILNSAVAALKAPTPAAQAAAQGATPRQSHVSGGASASTTPPQASLPQQRTAQTQSPRVGG